MSAIGDLDWVLEQWNERKINPSTSKLTISGEKLTELQAELARLRKIEQAAKKFVTANNNSKYNYPDPVKTFKAVYDAIDELAAALDEK